MHGVCMTFISVISIFLVFVQLSDGASMHLSAISRSSSNFNSISVSASASDVQKASFSASRFLNLRGGKKAGNLRDLDSEEEEDDEYMDEDDDIDDTDDIQQNQMMLSVVDMWRKTPPITQVYVGCSLVLTVLVFMLNKNEWPDVLNLDWGKVLGLQVWRPFTSFLFFGPFGFNYILTIHFVWTYMAQLEKLNYKHPEEFLIMLGFGISALLAGYTLLGLSPKFLGHNLSTFLVYIWARVFEGTDVNVMDLFNLKAEYLPWFFCLQTAVLEGEIPFADILGIVVGHLYQYLSQKQMLAVPQPIVDYFSSPSMKTKYAVFKEDFE